MGPLCYSFKDSKDLIKRTNDKNEIDKQENLIINNQILIKKSEGSPLDKYKIIRLIAEGHNGKLFLVQDKDVKVQRVMKEVKNFKSNEMEREVGLLSSMDHPNILKIFEYFYADGKIFIILDYCKEGDLLEIIRSRKFFKEKEASFIIYQVLLALNYCHSMKLIHRDIKPENIMVTSVEPNGQYLIKLIDFDNAVLSNKKEKGIVGSLMYASPEGIDGDYNEKSDIWSAGVLLFLLLSGSLPFTGRSEQETIKLILECDLIFDPVYWGDVSSLAQDLIKKMLMRKPSKRISALEALEHPWLNSFNMKETWESIKPERFQNFMNNLKAYKSSYKIEQLIIMIIVHNLPLTEEVKELEKIFKKLDVNKDGKLTKEELLNGCDVFFKDIPSKKEDLEEIFENCDIDGDGFIEYEEFLCACIDKKKLLCEDYLKLAFNFFDLDGSGTITLKELQTVLKGEGEYNISMDLIVKIVSEIDVNGDGKITFDEFKKFMRRLLSQKTKRNSMTIR
jgi:calcium-dependent protein kinase